jgi:hypothetical protein
MSAAPAMTAVSVLTPKPASVLPREDEFTRMVRMAEIYAKSGVLPRGITNMAAVALIIEQGYELGIPPAAALRTISIVEGKPTIDAGMQRALIKRDHGDNAFRFIETDALHCVIEYRRRGWSSSSRFTLTMAEMPARLRAKDVWKEYPANMLRARATTFVANMEFSDTTLGLHTPEELGADVDVGADGEVRLADARIVDADGVIDEPATIRLPWGITADQWARFHTEATARGVDVDPLMSPDEIAGAIRKGGGPPIAGKVTAANAWEALKHVDAAHTAQGSPAPAPAPVPDRRADPERETADAPSSTAEDAEAALAAVAALIQLRDHGFDLEKYLARTHTGKELSELTLAELELAVEVGRRSARN